MSETGPEFLPCAGLTRDIVRNRHVVRTCGEPFIRGNGVEACCSLPCWLLASERRASAEQSEWEVSRVGGYRRDPRRARPELYAYKGWNALPRETAA
jgi:hypothetical protein